MHLTLPSLALQNRSSTNHLRTTPLVRPTTRYVLTLFSAFTTGNNIHQKNKNGLNLIKQNVVPDDDHKT